MSRQVELLAADGHRLGAYLAEPKGKARAGLVVIQEIFGVNRHIRRVANDFAASGYLALAPALFDRAKPGLELAYTSEGTAEGRACRSAVGYDGAMLDTAAAVQFLIERDLKVGIVGYCWGGDIAYLAACRLPVTVAVSYYGGGVATLTGSDKPKSPIQFHYGEQDSFIPKEARDRAQAAAPDAPLYLYPADHGFNCDERPGYHAESAALAHTRTLEFLASHLD